MASSLSNGQAASTSGAGAGTVAGAGAIAHGGAYGGACGGAYGGAYGGVHGGAHGGPYGAGSSLHGRMGYGGGGGPHGGGGLYGGGYGSGMYGGGGMMYGRGMYGGGGPFGAFGMHIDPDKDPMPPGLRQLENLMVRAFRAHCQRRCHARARMGLRAVVVRLAPSVLATTRRSAALEHVHRMRSDALRCAALRAPCLPGAVCPRARPVPHASCLLCSRRAQYSFGRITQVLEMNFEVAQHFLTSLVALFERLRSMYHGACQLSSTVSRQSLEFGESSLSTARVARSRVRRHPIASLSLIGLCLSLLVRLVRSGMGARRRALGRLGHASAPAGAAGMSALGQAFTGAALDSAWQPPR